MENLNYKNKNIERKCLKNMQKHQFSMVWNNLLELDKDFLELEDTELNG